MHQLQSSLFKDTALKQHYLPGMSCLPAHRQGRSLQPRETPKEMCHRYWQLETRLAHVKMKGDKEILAEH